jgi:hypothetical protein
MGAELRWQGVTDHQESCQLVTAAYQRFIDGE